MNRGWVSRAVFAVTLVLAGASSVAAQEAILSFTVEPRAPESAAAFDAICRNLRDRDADASELGSLAAILDSAARGPRHRPRCGWCSTPRTTRW